MNTKKKALVLALAAMVAVLTVGCSTRALVLKTVMGTVDPYFHGEHIDGTQFEKLTDKVYTFKWNWYRNLVIDTDVGLVVIDPM